MKKLIACFCLFLSLFCFTGCNSAAKYYGGSMTIELPAGEKFIACDWDEDDGFWYLTRPMRAGEFAETYTFQQDTTWGVFEGTITIIEKGVS